MTCLAAPFEHQAAIRYGETCTACDNGSSPRNRPAAVTRQARAPRDCPARRQRKLTAGIVGRVSHGKPTQFAAQAGLELCGVRKFYDVDARYLHDFLSVQISQFR